MSDYDGLYVFIAKAIVKGMNNANRSFLLLIPDYLSSGISLNTLGRQSALAFDGAPNLDNSGVDGA